MGKTTFEEAFANLGRAGRVFFDAFVESLRIPRLVAWLAARIRSDSEAK